MSKEMRPVPVENMGALDKEKLAQDLLVFINDEIANSNAIFESYSSDTFARSVAEEVKIQSLGVKLQEFVGSHGYYILEGTLVFHRSSVAGSVLGANYLATTFQATNIKPAEFHHTMVQLDVPMDQLKKYNIFMAPEKGTYGFMQLGEVYILKEVDVPDDTADQTPDPMEDWGEDSVDVASE